MIFLIFLVNKARMSPVKKGIPIDKSKRLGLNNRQQQILLHILNKHEASVEDIRQELKLVRRTVQRDLKRLVEMELIEEIAKSKTDPKKHYKLL